MSRESLFSAPDPARWYRLEIEILADRVEFRVRRNAVIGSTRVQPSADLQYDRVHLGASARGTDPDPTRRFWFDDMTYPVPE